MKTIFVFGPKAGRRGRTAAGAGSLTATTAPATATGGRRGGRRTPGALTPA